MLKLNDIAFTDWTPGPPPPRYTSCRMHWPNEAFDVWADHVNSHIRSGCILRMRDGGHIIVGDATVHGWNSVSGIAGGDTGGDECPEFRTANITGIAYLLER
jgi:hypothetical protein